MDHNHATRDDHVEECDPRSRRSSKKLSYEELDEIPIEAWLDPAKLASLPLDGATVGVFGASHSSMIALPNLLNTPVTKVINFYRGPLKYAVFFDDWTLFDDIGLKGQAADWARENIDGKCPPRLERCSVGDPEFDKTLEISVITSSTPSDSNVDSFH